MRLPRPARHRMTEPVVVLIDVVFFLLVFFMLVGRMDATAPFDVEPPVALSGTDMPGGGVTLSIARDGALAVDGRPVDAAGWLDAMRAAAGPSGTTLIRVSAHAATELRHVLPRIGVLEEAGLGEVVLVVTPDAAGGPAR